MTKEQEEAIECLQKLPITVEIKHLGGRKEIETVLSMLEEKDKTISSKDRLISILGIEQDANEKELEKLKEELKEKDKQINQYQNMLATNDMLHVIECENKDKIIDLTAKTINNHDIDEDICKQMGQKENCNEFEDKERCKDCIKQYFENEAKELLNK